MCVHTPYMSKMFQIGVRDRDTIRRFEEVKPLVADELGVDPDELHRWQVVREAIEAYSGGDALGRWRDDE